jgi:hypothetical protein
MGPINFGSLLYFVGGTVVIGAAVVAGLLIWML